MLRKVGLRISANSTIIRGLAINRFPFEGISISGSGNVIEGNFVGTDITGTVDLGNGGTCCTGISVGGQNNRIGGTTPQAHNLISGNYGGISVGGSGNVVQGNFIGTDVTGNLGLGNDQGGVGSAAQTT